MSKKLRKLNLLNVLKISVGRLLLLITLGICSGVFNLLIISVLNKIINELMNNGSSTIPVKMLMYFLVCIIFWFLTRKLLSTLLIKITQKKLWEYRNSIIKQIFKSDLTYIRKNREKIYTTLTEDVGDISSASANLIDFMISVITVLCLFGYMIWLSVPFFVATLVMIIFGIVIYSLNERKNEQRFNRTKQLMDEFHMLLNAVLSGFKENKMDRNKQRDVYNQIERVAEDSVDNNTKAFVSFLDNQMIGQFFFYLLIGILLMFLGTMFDMEASLIVTYLFALMYLIGPLELIMNHVPSLVKAKIALNRIETIFSRDENEMFERERNTEVVVDKWQSLLLKNICFSYTQINRGFTLGPIDFNLNNDEIVFISGGNGSGKTTFINLILNLLKPDSGEIVLNEDSSIYLKDPYAYRSLFATVFSDFYLFEELYGVEAVSPNEVKEYLEMFELSDLVSFDGKKFSTQQLSTGQRKRLALISSLLEKKPILVLDEWAADQDPFFRKKFYTEILPLIKSKGITVLAITHDDSYFYCCDRLFNISEGRIQELLIPGRKI